MLANLRLFLWMTFITGIIYPLFITLIAQLAIKQKADGGILFSQEKAVGAVLIAQKFESEKYFWPRPSAINYNPLPSGGSNLGPISRTLQKAVNERKEKLLKVHGGDPARIPPELLFASGSGLDPHISPYAAYYQLDRVAKARGVDRTKIESLIQTKTVKRDFGFLGEAYVNVLLLNIALDDMTP